MLSPRVILIFHKVESGLSRRGGWMHICCQGLTVLFHGLGLDLHCGVHCNEYGQKRICPGIVTMWS